MPLDARPMPFESWHLKFGDEIKIEVWWVELRGRYWKLYIQVWNRYQLFDVSFEGTHLYLKYEFKFEVDVWSVKIKFDVEVLKLKLDVKI